MNRLELLKPELVQAYRATRYVVDWRPPFELRVDIRSPALQRLYRILRRDSAAFLTAWNPRSVPSSGTRNRAAQRRLERVLAGRGFTCVAGRGVDASGAWAAEESVLVPGMRLAEARRVGRLFRQNAVLWAGADAVPRLVLLRRAVSPALRNQPRSAG